MESAPFITSRTILTLSNSICYVNIYWSNRRYGFMVSQLEKLLHVLCYQLFFLFGQSTIFAYQPSQIFFVILLKHFSLFLTLFSLSCSAISIQLFRNFQHYVQNIL